MANLVPVRRALISVSDKADLVPFARALVDMGVEIVSTGGTAAALTAAGVKNLSVEQVTGFPEMMDGRVKSLHPMIHGAILARRDLPAHVASMEKHAIGPIDLVCVNLYPFEKTIEDPQVSREQAIENIDVGGPAVMRSAAKNHEFVTVVTSPKQYDMVIQELRGNEGCTTIELRRDLAAAAFSRTAEYDGVISAWMCSRRPEAFPAMLRLSYVNKGLLRYGENPHQKASVYVNPASGEPSVVSADVLHGKELSYNNLLDGSAALELAQELHELRSGEAAAVIVKHTNPCGVSVAATLEDAFERAYAGDSLAAYGGILAVSRMMDAATATRICAGEKFLEVVVAPGYEPRALDMLKQRWTNVRLLSVAGISHTGNRKINYRSIPGGMLVQDRDMKLAETSPWIHAAGPKPTAALEADAAFVFTVAKHLKSNAIAIGRNGQLLGAGPGQVDRVTSCKVAIEKTAGRIKNNTGITIAASDAFFPFPDGPALLIEAGVKCIVHPGGSKRDAETVDLCEKHNVTCLLTATRHFRH